MNAKQHNKQLNKSSKAYATVKNAFITASKENILLI